MGSVTCNIVRLRFSCILSVSSWFIWKLARNTLPTMTTSNTRLSITAMTVLIPRLSRFNLLSCLVIACNMCSPVCDNIYVVEVPRIPTKRDAKPLVPVHLQAERYVKRLARMVNVNSWRR